MRVSVDQYIGKTPNFDSMEFLNCYKLFEINYKKRYHFNVVRFFFFHADFFYNLAIYPAKAMFGFIFTLHTMPLKVVSS